MIEYTLTPDNIKWYLIKHMTLTTYSHYLERDNRFGIQKETISKRVSTKNSFKSSKSYFIDGCSKEFTSIIDLCDYWNCLSDDKKQELTCSAWNFFNPKQS